MADKTETKEEIIPVGPGVEDDDPGSAPARSDEGVRAGDDYDYPEGDDDPAEGRQEERAGRSDESDGDDRRDDEGLSRQQKKRRAQREKREREQRELAFLRSRNEQLERQRSQDLARIESRQTQGEVLAIDGRIAQYTRDVQEAETLYAQARKNNDPEAEVLALKAIRELNEGLQQTKAVKQQTVRAAQERQAAAQQPKPQDPLIASRAESWMRSKPWFDPQLRDEDSLVVRAVEQAVANDGRFDPRTDDYWSEVDRRLKRRLPERFESRSRARERDPDDEDEDDDDIRDDPPRRRVNGNGTRKPSGPVFKVGGRERTLRKGEVYIDEDRKQAMIEAGVWENEKDRERFMKSYQRYDRDAGRRPR